MPLGKKKFEKKFAAVSEGKLGNKFWMMLVLRREYNTCWIEDFQRDAASTEAASVAENKELVHRDTNIRNKML